MKFFHVTAGIVLSLALATPTVVSAQTEPAETQQSSQATTMRVDELQDMKVVNEKGEDIGEVDTIVRGKEDHQLYAVISVGGFLGIGEHDVLFALQDLAPRGGRLLIPPGITKDQLKNMPGYDDSKYDRLPDNQVVTVGARTQGGSR